MTDPRPRHQCRTERLAAPGERGRRCPPAARLHRARAAFAVALLAAALLGAVPAAADRLPLAGGAWIETRGPWREIGDRIVYLSAEGRLRSIAVREVNTDPARTGSAAGRFGHAIAEYPRSEPIPIPAPPPLPGPPRPRRPPAPPSAPVCVLANPAPGREPAWLCGGPVTPTRPAATGPIAGGTAPATARSAHAERRGREEEQEDGGQGQN